MRKQKKRNAPDFGKPSPAVKEAEAIYRQKTRERELRYRSNWPQNIPHDAEFESAIGILVEETLRRLPILMKHFRIDESRGNDEYFQLALHLAREFPMFDPFSASIRGRPRSVLSDYKNLVEAIEAIVGEKDVSVSQACENLSKDRQGQWKGQKKENLEAAYYRYFGALNERNDEIGRLEKRAKLKEENAASGTTEAAAPRTDSQ